ncbi:TadE/TadG family type IV pilus assembly protein [Methylobacterium radiodurans]|uniref:Pilus assembly protein TadE n=1 Tax=Methylobacterium radiodurans TaxID=2202828 RepID=A0A2U8VMZ1_9HYPH|nr:TadE/TadG family type IV pilus assembly protein [Methylobacterium radiodurans]AWN34736.1 pilus assembly protein TadE [Methylobacterium radiodurans]
MRQLKPAGSAVAALARCRAGSAMTEFALLLPVLLLILAGVSEYAHAIDNWRKLTLLARTVSDLTAQGDTQNPVSSGLMGDILASSSAVLRPFDSSGVKIVVSAMGVDLTKLNLVPKVCSSTASANATARGLGGAADLTVPPGFQTTGVRYILTEASMDYRPMLGSALLKLFGQASGTFSFKVSMPWPARGGRKYGANTYTEVILPGGAECK